MQGILQLLFLHCVCMAFTDLSESDDPMNLGALKLRDCRRELELWQRQCMRERSNTHSPMIKGKPRRERTQWHATQWMQGMGTNPF